MKNEKELMVCENPSPALAVAIPAIIVPALLGIGLALMFGSAFDFEFDLRVAIIIPLVASIVFAAVFGAKKKWLTIPAFILTILAFAVMCIWDIADIRTGLLEFLGNFQFYVFYKLPGEYPEAVLGDNIFNFIEAYLVVATCVTSYFLTKRRFILASLILYAPIFIADVGNSTMRPSAIPVVVAVCGLVLLFLSYIFRYKNLKSSGPVLAVFSAVSIACVIAVGAIFPEETYDKDEFATGILDAIQAFSEDASDPLNEIVEAAQNGISNPNIKDTISHQASLLNGPTNLKNVGPFNPTDEAVLKVKKSINPNYQGAIPNTDCLYLKVESLDTYKGNVLSSSKIRRDAFNDDYIQAYEEAPFTVEIEPLIISTSDIVPYYTDGYLSDNTEPTSVNPYNSTTTGKRSFAVALTPEKTAGAYSEKYLEDYVYGTNLEVPESTEKAIINSGKLPDWYMDIYYGNSTMSDAEKVRKVTNFVRNLHPYDTDTEYPPEGADFVVWFITDAKTGICVHYATTSVVLLRLIGIPARYVRGYVDDSSGTSYESVITAENAHAWFEFFAPEYGWIMGDSTPGNSSWASNCDIDALARKYPAIENASFARDVISGEVPSETDQSTTTESEEETQTTETTPASETDSATEPAETTLPEMSGSDASSDESAPDASANNGVNGNDSDSDDSKAPSISFAEIWENIRSNKAVRFVFAMLVVVMVFALAIAIFRFAWISYWRRLFGKGSANDKVISYYHYYSFMAQLFKFRLAPKATKIAEKAAFSQQKTAPHEIEALIRESVNSMNASAKSYGKFKTLLFKLLRIEIDHM